MSRIIVHRTIEQKESKKGRSAGNRLSEFLAKLNGLTSRARLETCPFWRTKSSPAKRAGAVIDL
jgi:hypothetical protein